MKKNSGFTLIEMLIVIAIIAILSGMVLIGVTGFQASARDANRVAQIRNAQQVIELYYSQCGHYPGGADCASGAITAWDGVSGLIEATAEAGGSELPAENADTRDTHDFLSCVVGGSVQAYTVGISLERGNAAAANDGPYSCAADGLIGSIDCSDSKVFCLSE